jgi:hypothetical protein
VVASRKAEVFVADHGGRLFVWPVRVPCCRGVTFLEAATEAAAERPFRRIESSPFEVLMDARVARLPDELHVELRGRRRKRVAAYWDGCAWVT